MCSVLLKPGLHVACPDKLRWWCALGPRLPCGWMALSPPQGPAVPLTQVLTSTLEDTQSHQPAC